MFASSSNSRARHLGWSDGLGLVIEGQAQGLTLRFQARDPKRSFDKKIVVKNRISGYFT